MSNLSYTPFNNLIQAVLLICFILIGTGLYLQGDSAFEQCQELHKNTPELLKQCDKLKM